jgi:hypothetical protein
MNKSKKQKAAHSFKIVLPRDYVSWSQLNCWNIGKERWWNVYVLGENGFNEERVVFGKVFSEAREKGCGIEEDMGLEFARIMLPSYPKREFEIEAVMGGIKLLGRLDSFDENGLKVGEDKTGKEWTKRMVDESEQLDFYALLVYAKYNKLPGEMRLNWAETKIDEWGNILATGRFEMFYTSRDLVRVMRMFGRVKRYREEVEAYLKERWSEVLELKKRNELSPLYKL